ncbi:MAG: alcohol dehydrogenase catalytic domain-containing protein [Phycisphaerales bacterium]|nr:alcohol dehydrogenase catalytic domain-containing protein [Phycisphaerales bacterium]
MRAICFEDRLIYDDNRPEPAPTNGDAVVRVHLAGICATDHHITRGYMGFRGIVGHECVGTVETGPHEWLGKRVVCEINCVCRQCAQCQSGLSNHCSRRTVMGIRGRDGCFADLVAVPIHNLHEAPNAITDEEAVFVEPLAAAMQVVKQVPIERRMNVAVVGSGRLGLLVAQVLATTGCRLEVIGRNPQSLLFCEKRGIRARLISDTPAKADRDLVVDCTGSPDGLAAAIGFVRPRGTIVLKSTHAEPSAVDLAPIVVNEITVVGSRCGPFADAIHALARREVDVSSMVSRSYKIERWAEAFEASQQAGNIKVLLKINPR